MDDEPMSNWTATRDGLLVPPGVGPGDPGWAEGLRRSRRSIMREWLRMSLLGPLLLLAVASVQEVPRHIAALTSTPPAPLRFDYGLPPDLAAAVLAVSATVLVAVALTSRSTALPPAFVAARESVWHDVATWTGVLTTIAAASSAAHAVGHPSALLPSMTLAGMGVLLTALAVVAAPGRPEDQPAWALSWRKHHRELEQTRYRRLIARWSVPSITHRRRWLAAEIARWLTASTMLIGAAAVVSGADTAWRVVLGSTLLSFFYAAIVVVALRLTAQSISDVLDRSPVGAALSALVALALGAVLVLLVVAQIVFAPAEAPARVVLTVPVCVVVASLAATWIAGRGNRLPQWRAFRIAWVVRLLVLRHCERRLAALTRIDTEQPTPSEPRGGRLSRWYEHVIAEDAG